jgi:hydrophobic/amphiphilic exporter-1 (mainly G- bacteria), HAE1 family
MFSKFFIYRPIFATVVALVIILAGVVTLKSLPIETYPNITPPTVEVSAFYPGANAQVISQTVATPIEEEVNGVEDMIYMSSNCASDGSYTLTVTFEVGTDLDMAAVLVQNRVAVAEPKLPEEVKRQGVTTKKKSTNIVLLTSITSQDGTFDDLYLSNYATLRLRDELTRLNGVGEVTIFGASDYSMRIWLDPDQLNARKLVPQDILDAIREQNIQVAAGKIGQAPAPTGQNFEYVIDTQGRLTDPKQFEDIILKTSRDGGKTRLKDVATIELGAQTYTMESELNGYPAASLAIYQLPGANALDVFDRVESTMNRLSKNFPKGMEYHIPFDTTRFVHASIREVYITLLQAAILVFLVIFVFLQDWRATLIPAIAIPVSLIGTFSVMKMLGFSINLLTLFGMVLAIGVVVDDAIVVVENTVRHLDESKLSPKEAAAKAMEEVTGPVVATTLVLFAVFIPTAFLGGITGQLYRQFALTIATATGFSSIVALSLSPALCGIILRPTPTKKFIFFRWFDSVFALCEKCYAQTVRLFLRFAGVTLLIYLALVVYSVWQFTALPTGFLPDEDQGYLFVSVQLPDAASQERTRNTLHKVGEILAKTEGVENYVAINGFSMLDGGASTNAGTFFVSLKDWKERPGSALHSKGILAGLMPKLGTIQEAVVFGFIPPAITGLGSSNGFQLQLQDKGNIGLGELNKITREIIEDGTAQSGLAKLNSTFRPGVPQLYLEVDREKAKNLGLSLEVLYQSLGAYLGSAYANDFNAFGRTYQVKVQATPAKRNVKRDIRQLQIRNDNGDMLPVGSIVKVSDSFGPQMITRYNLYPSASIMGNAAPGYSSGQALNLMEQMADQKLPDSVGYEWTGMSFQEKQVGSSSTVIFALAILLVFLVLAAQYESWSSPMAVIMSVPMALLGSAIALTAAGMDNNVYTQIGLTLLIALASKNAILIVEFANEIRVVQKKSLYQACIESAKLRFRPILMTAFSSVFGFFPLVIATGAGAASRNALGLAVIGGMIGATIFGLLFVPVFYLVCRGIGEKAAGIFSKSK